MSKSLAKSTALLLSIMMNWVGLLAVGETVASFSDTEHSGDNSLFAGALDYTLLPPEFSAGIGIGETVAHALVVDHATTTVRSQYAIRAEEASTTPGVSHGLCLALALKAWWGSTSTAPVFSGPLLNFAFATTASLTMPRESLPLETAATTSAGYSNGDICTVRFILDAYQIGSTPPFGFHDRSISTTTFTAGSAIVLNEFLPNPDETANGFNFGKDSDEKPLGEWVELYNNSDSPKDLAGWLIADESGGVGNTQAIISAANTVPATTIIPANGWLVVYFNKPVMNNSNGDSLYLYTSTSTGGVLVDSYTYGNTHDLCALDPTPGNINDTMGTTTGCSANPAAPPNKSYARIPDGVGAWVDPIPTPGEPNTVDKPPPPVFPDAPEDALDAPGNSLDGLPPVATSTSDEGALISTTTEASGNDAPAREQEPSATSTSAASTGTETTSTDDPTFSEQLADVLESSPMEYPEPPAEEPLQTPQDIPTTTPVTEQIESPGARVEGGEEEHIAEETEETGNSGS